MFQVYKKLKHLKLALKQWKKDTFDSPEVKIKKLREEMKGYKINWHLIT